MEDLARQNWKRLKNSPYAYFSDLMLINDDKIMLSPTTGNKRKNDVYIFN